MTGLPVGDGVPAVASLTAFLRLYLIYQERRQSRPSPRIRLPQLLSRERSVFMTMMMRRSRNSPLEMIRWYPQRRKRRKARIKQRKRFPIRRFQMMERTWAAPQQNQRSRTAHAGHRPVRSSGRGDRTAQKEEEKEEEQKGS